MSTSVRLEVVAEPWLEGLYPALQKFLSEASTDSICTSTTLTNGHANGVVRDTSGCVAERLQAVSLNDKHNDNDDGNIDNNKTGNINTNNNIVIITSVTSPMEKKSSSSADHSTTVSLQNNQSDTNGDNSHATTKYRNDSNSDLDVGSLSVNEVISSDSSSDTNMTVISETPCVKVDIEKVICDKSCGLLRPCSALDGKNLTVPALPPPFLTVRFSDQNFQVCRFLF